ncbi:MAG: hypothetical protein ACI8P0_002824 [Planctomycetaceae bacterium]|jgi:hypothetical protein
MIRSRLFGIHKMSSNLIEFGETIAKSQRRCDNPGTRLPTPAVIRLKLFKCRDVAST